ncbi:MAG: 6-phospho-beta-glucosidase [Treponema sp.]|nr:6-phospho-beta-glucosidase [Treponema sp.]
MKQGLKVATIGGGSSYTPELVDGFIKRYHEFPLKELWLVDIEAGREKQEIVGNLAKRMAAKAGLPIDIHMTLDRRAALEGADFITTQFRVGLLEARIKDERLPLKYNVIGQETNGPGGLFKGLRTIPVILDIIKDAEELCPDAWMINFTNPSGMVTEAVFRYTNWKKFIGLCNVPIGIERSVAEMFGVEPSRVRIDFAGLNHMVFGLKVYIDGRDRTDEAVKKTARPDSEFSMKNVFFVPWVPEFIEALGVLPCPYHRYYYKTAEMLAHALEEAAEKGTRAEVVKKIETDLFEKYKDPGLDVKPPELDKRGGAHYSDAACNLISSIYNDKKDIQYVNTLNRGAIPFLPNDVAVEVSAVITRSGAFPVSVGDLPVACQGLVYSIKSFERVAAEAAVTGDYKKALLAMVINPLVPGDKAAKELLDEMLQAHKEHLPQFFKHT